MELSEQEQNIQQHISDILHLFIPNNIIKLICEPLLYTLIRGQHYNCHYLERDVIRNNITYHLAVKKFTILLPWISSVSESPLLDRQILLSDLIKDEWKYCYVVMLMASKNGHDFLFTNLFNDSICKNNHRIAARKSAVIRDKNLLSIFKCYPVVCANDVKIHFNIYCNIMSDAPLQYSDNILIHCNVYVVMWNLNGIISRESYSTK